MSETIISDKKKAQNKRNLYVFGYGLVVIFGFLSWHIHHKHGMNWVVVLFCVLSTIMLVVTLTSMVWLKRIYTKWMIGAHFIGTCISGLALSLMYYLIFAPLGILFRIIKKDFLSRTLDKTSASYWVKLEPEKFDPKQCEKQF